LVKTQEPILFVILLPVNPHVGSLSKTPNVVRWISFFPKNSVTSGFRNPDFSIQYRVFHLVQTEKRKHLLEMEISLFLVVDITEIFIGIGLK
jgi:hypothetical protein